MPPFGQSDCADQGGEGDHSGVGKGVNENFEIEDLRGIGDDLEEPFGIEGVEFAERWEEDAKGEEHDRDAEQGGEEEIVGEAEQREAIKNIEHSGQGDEMDGEVEGEAAADGGGEQVAMLVE